MSPPTPAADHTPGICGGAACIPSTRIPIWVLVNLTRTGVTFTDLHQTFYPHLSPSSLVSALLYAPHHPWEIAADAERAAEQAMGADEEAVEEADPDAPCPHPPDHRTDLTGLSGAPEWICTLCRHHYRHPQS